MRTACALLKSTNSCVSKGLVNEITVFRCFVDLQTRTDDYAPSVIQDLLSSTQTHTTPKKQLGCLHSVTKTLCGFTIHQDRGLPSLCHGCLSASSYGLPSPQPRRAQRITLSLHCLVNPMVHYLRCTLGNINRSVRSNRELIMNLAMSRSHPNTMGTCSFGIFKIDISQIAKGPSYG